MVKMPPKKPVPASGVGVSTPAAPAKVAIVQEPVTLTVRRTYLANNEITGEETENTELEVNRFLTDTARVSATASYKKNMGNYESAEIRYSVTLPCYVEEIEDAFVRANEIVNEQLTAGLESLGDAEGAEVLADDAGTEEGVEEAEGDEGAEEAEAEEGISEEEVMSYDRDQLTELVTGNELDVDPEEYADNAKGLAKFRSAVWEALEAFMAGEEGGEEAEAEEAEAEEAEAEEGEAADTEEAFTPYTKEELQAFDLDQLEQLRSDWEMPEVKVPRGAKDKGKAAYIKAILDHQASFEASE